MQCGLNLITKPLNNRLSEIMASRVNDTSQKTIEPPSTKISTVDKQLCQTYEREHRNKKKINNEEVVTEDIVTRRQVKRIVKQEKRNNESSIARICKHNPKSLYFYINERRIVRDYIGPLN